MQALPSGYLAEIARQLSFLSAFLGGFAAAFYVTLLNSRSDKKACEYSLGSSAIAACGFVVAVISFVMISVVSHPDVPSNITSGSSLGNARIVGFLGFVLGVYALLVSVGISGWIRSRRLGFVTSIVAGVSVVLASWAIAGFG